MLFFLAGAWLGINRISLNDSPRVTKIMIAAAGVFVCAASAGASFATLDPGHAAAAVLFERVARFSGALLVICAAMKPIAFPSLSGLLLRLSPASFFLFASHYFVIHSLSRPLAYFLQGPLGLGQGLFLFGALFFAAVTVSLSCYFLLKRYAPSLLSVLDGNRSAGPSVPMKSTPIFVHVRPSVPKPAISVQ